MDEHLELCERHYDLEKKYSDLDKNIALIQADLTYIKDRMVSHIYEGEKPNGHRDKLNIAVIDITNLKSQISIIKKGYWLCGVVGGLIGGMFGKLTPELVNLIVRLISGR